MLMRTDPFRELDRLSHSVFGTAARPAIMPIDAYRQDGKFVVQLDLPGVDVDSIDLTVERNVLNVRAERRAPQDSDAERIIGERTYGTFSRQLFLGETLDVDQLTAQYNDGVLVIEIPVAEQEKARKISIGRSGDHKAIGAEAA